MFVNRIKTRKAMDFTDAVELKRKEYSYYLFKDGSVYSSFRGNIKKLTASKKDGILYVPTRRNGNKKCSTRENLATLVAINFVPNPDNLKYVGFKDGNKLNVDSSNLYWFNYTRKKVRKHIRIDLSEAKEINGYDGYFAFKDGMIYSTHTNKYIKHSLSSGCPRVFLHKHGKIKCINVCEIMASCFLGDKSKEQIIIFKDNNKCNVELSNLCLIDKPRKHITKKEDRILKCRNGSYVDNPIGNVKKIDNKKIVGCFYVSDMGYVYEKKEDGMFFEKDYYYINGHKCVLFPVVKDIPDRHGKWDRIYFRVYTLVLYSFTKNYNKWMRVRFIDGDKKNTSLTNLTLKCGFNGEIDVVWCKKVAIESAHKNEILISKYLIEKKIEYIYEAVYGEIRLIRGVLKTRVKEKDDINDLISDTFIHIIGKLDKGRYKPCINESKFIYWFIKILKNRAVDLYRTKSMFITGTDSSDVFIEKYSSSKDMQQVHEYTDYSDSIGEEIEEMFNDLY